MSSTWVPNVSRAFPQVADFKDGADGRPQMDIKDPVGRAEARNQRVRERQTAIAHTKLIQEKLRECYIREGVNHIQNCKELATQYLERIRAPEFGAHLHRVRIKWTSTHR